MFKQNESKQQLTKSSVNQSVSDSIKKSSQDQKYVLRTESILLPKGDTKHLNYKCNLSRAIYNSANYFFRSFYQKTGKGPNRSSVWKWLKNHPDLPLWKDAIGTNTCESIAQQVIVAFSSYFSSLKAWKINQSKFLSKPKPPSFVT